MIEIFNSRGESFAQIQKDTVYLTKSDTFVNGSGFHTFISNYALAIDDPRMYAKLPFRESPYVFSSQTLCDYAYEVMTASWSYREHFKILEDRFMFMISEKKIVTRSA